MPEQGVQAPGGEVRARGHRGQCAHRAVHDALHREQGGPWCVGGHGVVHQLALDRVCEAGGGGEQAEQGDHRPGPAQGEPGQGARERQAQDRYPGHRRQPAAQPLGPGRCHGLRHRHGGQHPAVRGLTDAVVQQDGLEEVDLADPREREHRHALHHHQGEPRRGGDAAQRGARVAQERPAPAPAPRSSAGLPGPGRVPRDGQPGQGHRTGQEPAALAALSTYGAVWARAISGPTSGQHTTLAASPRARAVPSAFR